MKSPSIELCWSEEDLAYAAWVAGRPACRATADSPAQAEAALLALLAARPESDGGEAADVAEARRPAPFRDGKPSTRKSREKLTRLEAASRQLDAAIRLFLAGDEPLAVHALTTSAGEVFADRLARWSGQAAGDSLSRQDYLKLLRAARDLLRSSAGEEALELDLAGNDALIAQAVADRMAACPFLPLSRDMARFRDWYRAARQPELLAEAPLPAPPRRRSAPPLPGRALQFSLLPEAEAPPA